MRSATLRNCGRLALIGLCGAPILLFTVIYFGDVPIGSEPGLDGLFLIRWFAFESAADEDGAVPYQLHMWPDRVPPKAKPVSNSSVRAYLAIEDQILWNGESAPVRTLYLSRDDVYFRIVDAGIKRRCTMVELEVLNSGDAQVTVKMASMRTGSSEHGVRQKPVAVGIGMPGPEALYLIQLAENLDHEVGRSDLRLIAIVGAAACTVFDTREVEFTDGLADVAVPPGEKQRIIFMFLKRSKEAIDVRFELTADAWMTPMAARVHLELFDRREYLALPEWKYQGVAELRPTVSPDFSPLRPPLSTRP